MDMQFKATVIHVNEIKTGTGSTGKAWKMQTILTETDGQYSKKVELTLFNDMVDKFTVGQVCNFHIEIESRLSASGHYFTSAKCFRFEAVGNAPQSANTQQDAPSDTGLPF